MGAKMQLPHTFLPIFLLCANFLLLWLLLLMNVYFINQVVECVTEDSIIHNDQEKDKIKVQLRDKPVTCLLFHTYLSDCIPSFNVDC
jgi:hypothetical protein